MDGHLFLRQSRDMGSSNEGRVGVFKLFLVVYMVKVNLEYLIHLRGMYQHFGEV